MGLGRWGCGVADTGDLFVTADARTITGDGPKHWLLVCSSLLLVMLVIYFQPCINMQR